ncbi:hypothetical protein F383_36685 [Gossypium arboreum]|uniref:Uncharacterized protein n=1 Tax=Gossypium arboreum TaxID=29729 RepID=A0A0B0M5I5_GOSAR|nr:hypothetical protein F383_36685 [Gossypium arboreum]
MPMSPQKWPFSNWT